jgi:hypothetical protein
MAAVGLRSATALGKPAHFFGAAAEAMRRILIDKARKRQVRAASGLASPDELHESRIELPALGDIKRYAFHSDCHACIVAEYKAFQPEVPLLAVGSDDSIFSTGILFL